MMSERPLRICFVMLYYAAARSAAEPAAYLNETPIHRALPQELAARGHQVDVVHLYPRAAQFAEGNVRFHFVATHPLLRGAARLAGRLARRDPVYYEPAIEAIKVARRLRPDIIHVHGLTLNLNLFLLQALLGPDRPPVVLHYHGGYPSRRRITRQLQRLSLSHAGRVCFTTRSQADPFVSAGMLAATRVVELVETSSDFRMLDRQAARAATGMTGDPVFVWAGRLHPVKGPMVALRGFERILAAWPDAQLYLYYLTDQCLPEMTAFIKGRPTLAAHVHFRGRAPLAEMERIYNSADFLLQASRREFSGCAVLEAMACGVIPVVTDIPSFRAMTDSGRIGVLFPIDDDLELARRTLAIPRQEIASRSAAVRAHFDQELSFASMAARLETIYANLLVERTDPVLAGADV